MNLFCNQPLGHVICSNYIDYNLIILIFKWDILINFYPSSIPMVRFLEKQLGMAFPYLFWPWECRSHTYLWSMTKKGHQKFWAEKITHFFLKKRLFGNCFG